MTDESMIEFGRRLRAAREAVGMSAKRLGRLLGSNSAKPANVVYQYEGGHRYPKYVALRVICVQMGVSADYLLGLMSLEAAEEYLTTLRRVEPPARVE